MNYLKNKFLYKIQIKGLNFNQMSAIDAMI